MTTVDTEKDQGLCDSTVCGQAPCADIHEIERAIRLLYPYDCVIEMRALKGARCGFYNNGEILIEDAAQAAQWANGVYVTLNPIRPDTDKLVNNSLSAGFSSATDTDIPRRELLLIDIDAERASNTNTTDAEHAAAIERARDIRFDLNEEGWPQPLLGDSGNGAHLLYRLPSLPNDEESRELIATILKELDARYSRDGLKVDKSVFNASRISKLYGTMTRKGPHSPERPQRMARILEAPESLEPISVDFLSALAASYVPEDDPPARRPQYTTSTKGFTMEEFIAKHDIRTRSKQSYRDGFRWQLDCPFNADHKAPDAVLFETRAGALGFKCSHDSCHGNRWENFRAIYEPRHNPARLAPMSAIPQIGEHDGPMVDLLIDGDEGFTDYGNATRIKMFARGSILWSVAEKSWYVWDGRRFEKNNGAANRLAQKTMLEFLRQALVAGVEEHRKFAIKSLDAKKLESALTLLKPHVEIKPNELDANRHLLNFLNGTVNLRTGVIQAHCQADRITRLIHHHYVPTATAPVFDSFLTEILPDFYKHIQVCIGYSLTGEVSAKVVFIAHGKTGNNGKTTLLDAIRNLAPEYSTKIMIDSLMVRQGGETNNSLSDLSDLKGARFANTSETESGQRLSEGKLKRITQGMGTIKSARKYENTFEFAETHKLWLDANHLPIIKGTDSAIWNRLYLIPFTVEISQSKIDRSLPMKLAAEAEGILAWAVAGAMEWYRVGLPKPEETREAVEDWKSEMDIVAPFIDARCIVSLGDASCWVKKPDIWEAYCQWAKSRADHTQLDKRSFFDYLESKGFTEAKKASGTIRAINFLTLKPVSLYAQRSAA